MSSLPRHPSLSPPLYAHSASQANIPIGMPAASYKGAEYGAIVYGRGPLFTEALADKMGQATFDQFLRDYYESHKRGIGTSAAFRQYAEMSRHCLVRYVEPVFQIQHMFRIWHKFVIRG